MQFSMMYRCTGWLVVVTSLGALGCTRPQPTVAPTKPPEVTVELPIIRTVTDYEDFTGRTEAYAEVALQAMVTGRIDAISFEDGDQVKKDQLLFRIWQKPFQAEVDRAKANLKQAQAHNDRTRRDLARAMNLKGSISTEEIDKFRGDNEEAEAAVGVAEQSLEIAKVNLEFTEIRAPFDGKVSRRMVHPGSLVKADETVLTTIVSINPIYAYFDVDDRTLLQIRRLDGDQSAPAKREPVTVQVGLPDRETFEYTGVVDFIDNKIDVGTGTLRQRARIANPNLLLSPGQFVRIRLPVGKPHPAVLLPEEALGTDQGHKFVYVLNDKNEVQYRKVELGAQHEVVIDGKTTLRREILRNGISPQDRVIVSGLQRVRPGTEVVPKGGAKPTPPAPASPSPPASTTQTTVAPAPPPRTAGGGGL